MAEFNVEVDHENQIVTIQGIKYAFGLFNALGFASEGLRFEIGKREDGVVQLRSLPRAGQT